MEFRKGLGWVVAVASAGAMFATLQACAIASPTYVSTQYDDAGADDETPSKKDTGKSTDPGSGTGQATCDAPFVKADLSKLKACENGKGHCYAKDMVPSLGASLVACPGSTTDVCVPDTVLEADGGKLKSCTSYGGKPGGCITWSLMPEVAKQGGDKVLPKDVCTDPNELCLPCVDPISKQTTPFCQPIGVTEKACSGAAAPSADAGPGATACCNHGSFSSGICIDESPQTKDAPRDSCASGEKCVPTSLATGKPVTCSAGILGNGVCMDKCFSNMLSVAGGLGFLSSNGCRTTELCVPCFGAEMSGQKVPGCE